VRALVHRATPLREAIVRLAGAAAEGRFTGRPLLGLLQGTRDQQMAVDALADYYPFDRHWVLPRHSSQCNGAMLSGWRGHSSSARC
jgi:hypothetical protein